MLRVKNLSVAVGKKKIIDDFSFTFETDKIYAIMGPNGSGKSTLAYALMGHPTYKANGKSKMEKDGKNIFGSDAQKRSEMDMFLSFQTPLSLSGVNPIQLIQFALSGKEDALKVRKKIKKIARELRIPDELLTRSLNENVSGGEKKKLEILQSALLDKKFLIFDEVDTGVDIDALKTIANFLQKHKKGKTYILITHYNRILHYLRPDKVLILIDGKLIETGDYRLAERIEKEGYRYAKRTAKS